MIDCVPLGDRNSGYSFGLEYPFIYGYRDSGWAVWNRHSGEITWTIRGGPDWHDRAKAAIECERQNADHAGIEGGSLPVDFAAIDATP